MGQSQLREWKAARRWSQPRRHHRRRPPRVTWERRSHSSRHRHGRRARRRLVRVLLVVGAVTAAGAILLYRDLGRVRAPLEVARATLQAAASDPDLLATDAGRAGTLGRIDAALEAVATARRQTVGSPTLSAVGWVPVLRGQRSGLLQLIDDSASAAATGRELVATLDGLADRTSLADGVIPIEGLRELRRGLGAASDQLDTVVRNRTGLLGPLGDARRQFDTTVSTTSARLADGADALGAALPFMGAEGPRTYFVAAQNNAEMRDQGMVLSYAVLRFEGGRFSLERNGSVGEIALTSPAPTPVPEGTTAVFGSLNPTTLWHSVNATADFAWSGRAMADMYRQATGRRVDGVIALDVPAVSKLLTVLGPVTVPGIGEPVTAQNVSRILLHDLYRGLPPSSDQGPRQELLSDVTRVIVQAATTGRRDAVALGRRLGEAAAGGHLRLWSAAAPEEEVFERTGLGGGPAAIAPDRTFHVAVQNRTATKLDYFVRTSVRQVVDLDADGDARVRTTVVIENRAPTDAQPSYQLGPDRFTSRPGEYRAAVYMWAPPGSQEPPGPVAESGLSLTHHLLVVNPGERVEVPLAEAVIPDAVRNGRLELRLVPQPRLEAPSLEVRLSAPGWRVSSKPVVTGPWDRTITAAWNVHR